MRPSLSTLAIVCAAALTGSVHAQVKAQDTETPSYVQFSAPRFEVSETETNAVITVVRSGDFRNNAAVSYKTVEGTAANNVDFEPSGGTIVFSAGQSFKTISIAVLHAGKPATDKTFKVALVQPSANTIIVSPAADVSIKQAGPALSIALGANGLSVVWPDAGAAYALEAQVNGTWSAVTTAPALADGSWSVRIDPTQPVALFRLRLE